jgi:hypothetical protein
MNLLDFAPFAGVLGLAVIGALLDAAADRRDLSSISRRQRVADALRRNL